MVVVGVPFEGDGGTIELLCPDFLYLFDFVLEAFVVLFTKHILDLIVKVFLVVLYVDPKGVSIESVGIGVYKLIRLKQTVLRLFVGPDHSHILRHLSSIYRDCFVVNNSLADRLEASFIYLKFKRVVVIRE